MCAKAKLEEALQVIVLNAQAETFAKSNSYESSIRFGTSYIVPQSGSVYARSRELFEVQPE